VTVKSDGTMARHHPVDADLLHVTAVMKFRPLTRIEHAAINLSDADLTGALTGDTSNGWQTRLPRS
jgi:hypothetical protein